MALSAEGQHLINSLEAHFAALLKWIEGKDEETKAHVEEAHAEVLKAIGAAGLGASVAVEPAEVTPVTPESTPAVAESATTGEPIPTSNT